MAQPTHCDNRQRVSQLSQPRAGGEMAKKVAKKVAKKKAGAKKGGKKC